MLNGLCIKAWKECELELGPGQTEQRAVGNDEDTTKDSFGQNQLSSTIREKRLNGKTFPDMSKLSLWLHET